MTVYLLLGGNIGNTRKYFSEAKEMIQKKAGDITKESSLYESEPWGFTHDQNFLNSVLEVSVNMEPIELLDIIQSIERELGRVRKKSQYSERTIDIDILFYDSIMFDTERLTIPHKMLHKRRFTMMPLNEIIPDYIHPVFNKSIRELTDICEDESLVKQVK